MDLMGRMAVNKAFNNLSVAIGSDSARQRLAEFGELRHAIGLADALEDIHFRASAPEVLLEFREKFLSMGDDVFADAPYAALTSAYLESLAPFSVLDSLKQRAVVLNRLFPQAIFASGYAAGAVSEAAPKAVKQPSFQKILTPPQKIAAIVAWSDLLDNVPEQR